MTDALSLRDRLALSPDVVCRDLDGEAVILNLETAVYFGLNASGTRMWHLIEQHGSLQRVFDALAAEYDVPPETLEADLLDLAAQVRAKGLVQVLTEDQEHGSEA